MSCNIMIYVFILWIGIVGLYILLVYKLDRIHNETLLGLQEIMNLIQKTKEHQE